jgi:hypothetical protein
VSIRFGTFAVFGLTILLSVSVTSFAQAKKPGTLAELVAYAGADGSRFSAPARKLKAK